MTTAEMAVILDLTPRRLQQLTQEGIIPGNGRNGAGYELVPAVRAYVKYLRSGLRTARNDQLRIEQTRLVHENANAAAMENKKTRGTLIEAQVVYERYVGIFVKIRTVILSSDLSDDEKADLLAELRRAAQPSKSLTQ